MKKLRPIILLVFLVLVGRPLFAQTLYLAVDSGVVKMKITVKDKLQPLNADELKLKPITNKLVFDVSKLPAGAEVKFFSTPDEKTTEAIPVDGKVMKLASNQYSFVQQDVVIKVMKVTVKLKEAAKPVAFEGIGANSGKADEVKKDKGDGSGQPATGVVTAVTYPGWRDFLANGSDANLGIIKGRSRYFSKQNRAYISLDPYGNIIGRKPVNLDQDDEVIVLMIVPKELYDIFNISDNDAEYAPTDLAFAPSAAIELPKVQKEGEKIEYAVKVFEKGPYTSSNVTFTAMRGTTTLSNTTIHINPLYHLGLGVSYISSSIESPDYQVVPLTATTNTIKAVNGGRRTFLTVNAIWYWWSTLRYLNGSDLTRGRDVLKEPNLITRINPTFGIGLKGNLENNFFTGFNFEFARGGSLTAGWHYGKVTTLLDESFQPGVTQFAGQQSDIKTFDRWKWGGYFGIMLDTRIFNKLFSASK